MWCCPWGTHHRRRRCSREAANGALGHLGVGWLPLEPTSRGQAVGGGCGACTGGLQASAALPACLAIPAFRVAAFRALVRVRAVKPVTRRGDAMLRRRPDTAVNSGKRSTGTGWNPVRCHHAVRAGLQRAARREASEVVMPCGGVGSGSTTHRKPATCAHLAWCGAKTVHSLRAAISAFATLAGDQLAGNGVIAAAPACRDPALLRAQAQPVCAGGVAEDAFATWLARVKVPASLHAHTHKRQHNPLDGVVLSLETFLTAAVTI